MLRLLAVYLVTVGMISSAQAQDSYAIQTTMAAQEALVRLGYDVGGIDGKWGKKARAAMNDLREKNGLPAAQELAGSSLELVHQLSAGATTLPNPGVLITDPVERRALLTQPANFYNGSQWCPAKVDEVGTLAELLELPPVAVVDTSAGPKNYISRDEDWFSPIMQTMLGAHNLCIVGNDQSCQEIVSLMTKWASADALEPGAKRTNKRRFDDIAWIANSLLRNFTFAYADARRLVTVDRVEDANVLDWLKRRIDEYNYFPPSGNNPGEVNYAEAGNHAMATMMPALAFGAMVGDRSMMQGAFDTWRLVMDHMREDGSLPTETRRGARSLQYTNFELAQLISTAEVARGQGIDLYAQAPTGKTIQKIVEFLLDAYEDFDKVEPYAKYNEGSPGDYRIPYIIQMHFGWLPTYFVRFGADANIERMRTLEVDSRICSPEALDENKLARADRICSGSVGQPVPFVKVLKQGGGTVGEAASYFMGYPAQCLQGVTASWPMLQ